MYNRNHIKIMIKEIQDLIKTIVLKLRQYFKYKILQYLSNKLKFFEKFKFKEKKEEIRYKFNLSFYI